MDGAHLLLTGSGVDRQRLDEPRAIEALYATAHWLMGEERLDQAAQLLRIMLHQAPRDERPWLALGQCHERHGQDNVALELYGLGTIAARSSRCHLARAQVFSRVGHDDRAAEELERASALGEDDADLLALIRQVAGVIQ